MARIVLRCRSSYVPFGWGVAWQPRRGDCRIGLSAIGTGGRLGPEVRADAARGRLSSAFVIFVDSRDATGGVAPTSCVNANNGMLCACEVSRQKRRRSSLLRCVGT